MRENREFICVTCPVGCSISVTAEGDALVEIHGQACQRGEAFVREELAAPKRMLTSTVRVTGGEYPLAPVRTTAPVPKPLLLDVAAALRRVVVEAPVAEHQVIVADVLGTGVDIVASRDVARTAGGAEPT